VAPNHGELERRWYGWQTLAVDGAALSLTLGGFADAPKSGAVGLLAGGALTFVVGAPVVHIFQGNVYGFVSLMLRVGLPYAGGRLGGDPSGCPLFTDSSCDQSGLVDGILAGAVLASILDASLIAWTPERRAAARRVPAFALSPLVGAGRSGLGVAGAF
jgi:hypothetical protein